MFQPTNRKSTSQPLPVACVDRESGWLVFGPAGNQWLSVYDVRTSLGIVNPRAFRDLCRAADITPVRRPGLAELSVTLAEARALMAAQREKPP